ncbi:hypothetical protein EZV61_19315 [Corallincola luteus]|uniref:Uncharacterized protein n=1 Tax=Corallincola luteus TaxID=1775177 RepID=A0ABY2AGW9_9GAMM|nr:hypothetical protein [Corallincola luteus]TCI01077.1 hypothetical protein EZV61_19315 [Corallincola luteus]
METNEYFLGRNYGFGYPDEYERLIPIQGEFGELRWWFLGSSSGLFDVAYNLINKDLASSIELIPFAKSSETNALACFDKSGKVYFVIGNASLKRVDWSKRLTVPSISHWYQGVTAGDF